jgi:hypothetical protein
MRAPPLLRDTTRLWTRAFLVLGLVLAIVAVAPTLIAAVLFPAGDFLIPGLVLLLTAPLAALSWLTALAIWFVGLLRR